ncbi:MAG: RNA polymerase Rpb4 [Candidatus Bathyarchaeota archaeon]|nr:RNA polymerase Rpb4 [Candidatus Bathyarchaeota archaeon]
MARKASRKQPLSIPQVKKILETMGEEQLDQFQRRSLDYAAKFSKLDSDAAESLVKALTEKFELNVEEAVQIANSMPKSIEELRVFLAGGRRIVETSKLESILSLLDENREEK